MKRALAINLACMLILLSACRQSTQENSKSIKILPPEELYGQLFTDIQSDSNLFVDSKTFVDCTPKFTVDTITNRYQRLKNKANLGVMRDFIAQNFIVPENIIALKTDSLPINGHITALWNGLKRHPGKIHSGTLIPLPQSYIVPGGRFREIYYWDSYFTMLGLQTDGQFEMMQNMVANFASLIERYGFIPNGNRTYYLSRSQPPFYALMIQLLAESKGADISKKYLSSLEKEYAFWMNGSENLSLTQTAYRRVVRLPQGEILNRYWDDNNTPRPESYREDIRTYAKAQQYLPSIKQENLYRNIRAAAESGWDFSSRWLTPNDNNGYELYTIHTTDIIPVDLNTLLYNLEYLISKIYAIENNTERSDFYLAKSTARKNAILKYCWSKEEAFFMDYNFIDNKTTGVYSLAGMFPLFFNIAQRGQAELVATKIESSFLKNGGVVTSLNYSQQQWDAPNGWAPLQWITIKGLRNYGYFGLADDIKTRWLGLNESVYKATYKMLEKYNVVNTAITGGGGEYPTQDGFGWTNGVFQKLAKEKNTPR